MYEQILYEVDEPVALITLNRPDKLNAWTDRMASEVKHAIAAAESDKKVVGVIITGAGRSFCAGADMGTLEALSAGATLQSESTLTSDPGDPQMDAGFRHTYSYLASTRKPIIAAINGHCVGMAIPIVCFCDMRFASDKASFHTAFSRRGLVAEWGISWILPRLVGTAHAFDMLFSARKITAQEAASMGLVNRVVPAEELVEHCRKYIRDLAENCSPGAMAIMKRQVYQSLLADLDTDLKIAGKLMVETFGTADFKEGVASFVEKRPPRFERLG